MSGALLPVLAVLFGGLATTLLVALRRRDGAAIVNALASLAVALASIFVAAGAESPLAGPLLAPALPVWVAAAGLLHAVGMLGPYESVWWWDHLTHTLSAALAAALVYAVAVTWGGGLSQAGAAAITVGYVAALGVAWEVLELVARAVGERYDVDPVLVQYGWADTAFDLVFDVVGAALVVAVDLRAFVDLAARYPDASRALLGWIGVAVAVGAVLASLVLYRHGPQPS